MSSVQSASAGKLPRSVIHFMEEVLTPSTKEKLLILYNEYRVDAQRIAEVMIAAGNAVDHGSTEPVEEYINRELLQKIHL